MKAGINLMKIRNMCGGIATDGVNGLWSQIDQWANLRGGPRSLTCGGRPRWAL